MIFFLPFYIKYFLMQRKKIRSTARVLLSFIILRRLAKYHCDIRFVHHQDHPIRRAFFAF